MHSVCSSTQAIKRCINIHHMLYSYCAFAVNDTFITIKYSLHIEEIIIIPKKVENQQQEKLPITISRT